MMELLFQGRLADYMAAAAPGPDGLCLFVHVPKTAGTSLRSELAALLRPEFNIAIDYTDAGRSFQQRMDEAVEAFLADALLVWPRFASGHILPRHTRRICAALPGTRLVTLLRDPVARVVSDYRHQRSPRHPVHAAFTARVPDLDAYLALRSEANKMALHLVPAEILRAGDPAACIDHVMRSFAFIGVQEMYPICFRALTTLLGRPLWPRLRENVTGENPAEGLVSPELAARIRAANPIDEALYRHVQAGWQRARGALAQALAGA